MTRREFITLVVGAAAAWPLTARAQQRIPSVGFLFAGTSSLWSKEVAAFAQRLGELGWIEGRTVAIEYRWVESRTERLAAAAAEFVELKVDVIVTPGTAVPAVKQVTSVIPIVFPLGSDPVASGFVASLARPGGNVTGLSIQAPDLAGKRVELLREVLPGLRGLAILGDAAYAAAVLEMGEVEVAARKLGLDTARVEIRRGEDIAPAIAALKGHADALYACAGALVVSNTTRISSLASTARLPTIYPSRPYLAGGGFIVLWTKLPGPVPASRRDGRQNFAWSQAGRHPGRAAHEIRSCHQSNHGQSTRPYDSRIISAARRRASRMKRRAFITLLGSAAAAWPLGAGCVIMTAGIIPDFFPKCNARKENEGTI